MAVGCSVSNCSDSGCDNLAFKSWRETVSSGLSPSDADMRADWNVKCGVVGAGDGLQRRDTLLRDDVDGSVDGRRLIGVAMNAIIDNGVGFLLVQRGEQKLRGNYN